MSSPSNARDVLATGGASLSRDIHDARIIAEVIAGTSTYGVNGHIDSPEDVGGWPEYLSTAAPNGFPPCRFPR